MHRRLPSGDRHVGVAERARFGEDLVEHFERQKEVLVLCPSTVDGAEAMGAVQVADVIQLNADAWHKSVLRAFLLRGF
jgi:hypothetical protein